MLILAGDPVRKSIKQALSMEAEYTVLAEVIYIYQKLPFLKKGKKRRQVHSFHNENRTIILSFKKAILYIYIYIYIYILSIKKYD